MIVRLESELSQSGRFTEWDARVECDGPQCTNAISVGGTCAPTGIVDQRLVEHALRNEGWVTEGGRQLCPPPR